jgi:hypothetical protein
MKQPQLSTRKAPVKIKILAALLSAVTLFTIGLANPANATQLTAKKDTYKLVLFQAPPTIKTWDLNATVPGARETIFGAKLSTNKGRAFGYLTGSIVSTEIAQTEATGEVRHRNLTYTLPGGQILAKGNSFYPANEEQLTFNESAVIAVIGGTGKYLGARGEVATTRKADGTYRHVFTLLK